MPGLNISYRCCDKKLPRYLKHTEVEEIAGQVRQQLVDATCDRLPQETLASVDRLNVNGIPFELYLSMDHMVHDEDKLPILGVCEIDPDLPETVIVCLSPVSAIANAQLVQSTLAHEFGHAVFDAPGWMVSASMGPGLFDDPTESRYKSYRTATPDAEHLSPQKEAEEPSNEWHRSIHFAELRANEFMGSLLVPRLQLARAVQELAPAHGVTVCPIPAPDPKFQGTALRLTVDEEREMGNLNSLNKAMAERFGVNPRFIQVRMKRYDYQIPEAQWT